MVAFAMHLLRTTLTQEVLIHPDGEHGKRFDFAGCLGRRGSSGLRAAAGRTMEAAIPCPMAGASS